MVVLWWWRCGPFSECIDWEMECFEVWCWFVALCMYVWDGIGKEGNMVNRPTLL